MSRLGVVLLTLFGLVLGLALVLVWGVGHGHLGSAESAGEVIDTPVPDDVVAERARRQGTPEKQILFGDLHVHTTFSNDAFLFSLPMLQGEGAHPPADACDFARFCADLDFWSITDHAELITPRQWAETRESIRQCNAVSGDEENPDLVAFVGWEWTNFDLDQNRHWGHKNVIMRGTAEDEVPLRPIGTGRGILSQIVLGLPLMLRILPALIEFPDVGRYLDFNRYAREAEAVPICESGIDVRDLPLDCHEYAPDPAVLFEKLGQWGYESIVIPHGTSWGIHAPPGSGFERQLRPGLHDPDRQRLFEIYSGHGTSEQDRPWRHLIRSPQGDAVCPKPSDGFMPCCWRAGELIRARCGDVGEEVCAERVAVARSMFADAGLDPIRFRVVTGVEEEEWLGCGQLLDDFLPAFNYRPGMSGQHALALGGFEGAEPGDPLRFRFGFVGSSDNHYARAGTGYKEFSRPGMSDARGVRNEFAARLPRPEPPERSPLPQTLEALRAEGLAGRFGRAERGSSFFYTGGLAAVHAAGRGRQPIWDALQAREVYATSGDRILLYFDLLNAEGGPAPMGSEVSLATVPRFRVRAIGALRQKPGCPDHSLRALTPERLELLCKGECYNPTDERKRITRIEVVRIRPQIDKDESVIGLVQDPWLEVACDGDPSGCIVEFEDPTFAKAGRETAYYVRAIQEPTPAINGDPLRCEVDEAGRCIAIRPCYASGPNQATDDCLAPVEERAWSSPIFVDPAPRGG